MQESRLLNILNEAHLCLFTVSVRLKSVKNIEKITKSMKMVSAAKFQLAERELKPARSYGEGAQGTLIHSTHFLLNLCALL